MSFNSQINITFEDGNGDYLSIFLERPKRDMSLEERGKQCKAMELSQKSFGLIGDILGDINSIPIIGDFVGTVTAGATIVTHLTAGGLDIAQTALDCADLPFDEIKEILDKRFNEVNRKLDKNTAALEAVTKLVGETLSKVEELRNHMNKRFDEVLVSIKETAIWPLVSKINNFAQYFDIERERIVGLQRDDYINKLEEPNSILLYLKDSRTPKGDSLHAPLLDIINQGHAVPSSIDDQISFKALYALLYGTQTYISVMFFLLEQYSYLANYYYEKGHIDAYNIYFEEINAVYSDFKSSLTGSGTSNGESILDKVNEVLMTVKNKEFLRLQKDELVQTLNEKIDNFREWKDTINGKILNILTETPLNFQNIEFNEEIPTPIGDWVNGRDIRYAVQYKSDDGKYSKVIDWSKEQIIRAKACPTLRMTVDSHRKTRLIFRRVHNHQPQLVGTIQPYDTHFRDIDRDLYNAAELTDKGTGLSEARIFLNHTADMTTQFEKGRTVLHAAANSGNTDIVFLLLAKNPSLDINLPDKNGFTPMHIAADLGNAGFVKFLTNHEAFVNPKTNNSLETPLHLVARHGFVKTARRLLESSDIRINEENKDGFTPLHNAVLGGKNMIETLMEQEGIEINPKSAKGLTPFHLSAINNDCPVAETLIRSTRIEVNAGDEKNMTPLHYAAMLGHKEMTHYLMTLNGIDLNALTADNKWSPLHYAIFFKKDEVSLELMKSNHVNLNIKADGEITPLHFAVTFGRKAVVTELLRKHDNIEEKTKESYTALHLAAMRKDPEILEILINNDANIEAKTGNESTPLHVATSKGRTNTALTLLNSGANINATDKFGQAPIHSAAMNDQLEVVRAVINRDPTMMEIKNRDEETPLNVAALHFHSAVVKDLLEKGADINTRNKDGMSPLLIYAKNGNLDMVKYLINKKADVYIADNEGLNFFYHAIQNGHFNIVQYAVVGGKFDWNRLDEKRKRGCPEKCIIAYFALCDSVQYDKLDILKFFIESQNTVMCHPLYAAARHGQLDIVKYLVEVRKVKVDGRKIDRRLNTPLCDAALNGRLEVVKYLVSKKAEVNARCEFLLTVIDIAIFRGHMEVVKYLAENGAHLNQYNFHGNTPLLTALFFDRFEIARYFVEEKAEKIDIDAKNKEGNTPLHLAVAKNNLELAKFFIEHKASMNVENDAGQTPLDLARAKDHSDIVQYLQTKGGRFFREISNNEYIGAHQNLTHNSKAKKQIHNYHAKLVNDKGPASYTSPSNISFQNVDVIGTLLLLDVAIRYFTKQRYVETRSLPSNADIQVAALQITEKFEDLLSFFSNVPVEEQLDLSEVHRNVYTALKSGKESQVHQVLCSYVNALSTLKPEDMESLISNFLATHSSITIPEISLKRQTYEHLPQLLVKTCLIEKNSNFALL